MTSYTDAKGLSLLIHYILNGTKIQASVRRTLVTKYLPILEEGNVYRMAYFTVIPNLGSYRATRHEYCLVFQFRTSVAQATLMLIPQYGLNLTPFSEVLSFDGDSDFLIDCIGLSTAVVNKREYEREGKVTKMVVIEKSDDMVIN